MVKPFVQKIYEFEDFRLDAAHLMLYRGGEEISLAPKAVQTLLALVERRGEIVSKDELMETIWKGSIVEEANLTQYIHILRKILGTAAADGKPLIETLRRRGYRFNGDVRESKLTDESSIQAQAAESEISENGNFYHPSDEFVHLPANAAPLVSNAENRNKIDLPTEKSRRRILLTTISLAAFAVLLVLAVSAFFSAGNKQSSVAEETPAITLKRLTPDHNAIQPTISPDGKYLVYSMFEIDLTRTLRLKDLTSGSEVQIMRDGQYMDLAFSSDGRQIYYLAAVSDTANSTLFRIPFLGGKPQEIAKNVISPPAVSPDGKRIALIKGGAALTVLDETGETENLLASFAPGFMPTAWNSQMSWSPDGERVALCGKDDKGRTRILDFSIKDRIGQFLPTPNFSDIDDAMWLADGSGLLITAKEKSGEPYQIWRVEYPSGEAWRITRDFNNYDWISLSGDSKTLVVGQNITKSNVWLASFDDLENPKQITFGSEAQDGYRGLTFAPGGKIIFTSPRSGNVDLWQINADGGEPQPLTADQGSLNIAPRITPDGRYIVFASSRGGDKLHIWRMDADGQNPLQMTNGANGDEVFFDISPDANRIFYAMQNGQKQMTTMQVSISGGEPSRINDDYQTSGGINVSPDGKLSARYVYLNDRQQPWRYGIFPIEGGEPIKLLEISAFRNIVRWSADGKSLLYIKPATSQLWQQPIDGSPPAMLSDLKTGWLFNFAVSPDYKKIVLAYGSQFSEAVLIENFGKR